MKQEKVCVKLDNTGRTKAFHCFFTTFDIILSPDDRNLSKQLVPYDLFFCVEHVMNEIGKDLHPSLKLQSLLEYWRMLVS